MNGTLKYKSFEWKYATFGKGEKFLLAFHGFDRSGKDFEIFEAVLGAHYTLVAFDLFYHGQSGGPPKTAMHFSKEDLKEMIAAFCMEKGVEKISLMGYSLGGRVALCILEALPNYVEKVYLLAPDGIKLNKLYDVARRITLIRSLLGIFVLHPGLPFFCLLLLRKSGILSERLYNFLRYQIETQERRERMINTWKIFGNINPDIRKVWQLIQTHNIPTDVFYGKYDPLEPAWKGEYFVSGIPSQGTLHIVDAGHGLVSEKTARILRSE